MTSGLSAFTALIFALSATACNSAPRALVAGEDSCRYCRMTIDDVRFGGLVVTIRGREETFDAIECLAAYVAALPDSAAPQRVLVADYEQPSRWIEVTQARFVHRGSIRSPMAREMAAFSDAQSAQTLQQRYGGRVMNWTEVLAVVRDDQFAPTGAGAGAASHAH